MLFVAIGNAFAVLSSPEKRQRYDRYGTEEEQVPVMSHRHFYHNGDYEYDFTRGFEGERSIWPVIRAQIKSSKQLTECNCTM